MELSTRNHQIIADGFISSYKEEVKSSKSEQVFNFNILSEQCGNIVENSHTNILMRLLQYRNRYGYVFLEDFISIAGFDISIDSKEVIFNTEFFGLAEKGKGRIDGLIYQEGNFAIIIENKINHAGNQENQVLKYIQTVVASQIVSTDKIYVVFLTRNGMETPDDESLKFMKECGICDNIEKQDDNEISGARYFGCSYSAHIYDWLKEDVQPSILHKDYVLNAGVIQYINYLEGLLGKRVDNQILFDTVYRWFNDNVLISGNIAEQNNALYQFYRYLSNWEYTDDISEESRFQKDAITLLMNVINKKNDELMNLFLTVTRDFFIGGDNPLMKEYHLNHHFTYYYITIRDKAWANGIVFGWYPMGLKKLINKNELTFTFNYKKQRLGKDNDDFMNKLGFMFDEKSGNYRKSVKVIDNTNFMNLSKVKQEAFLKEVYKNLAVPIIQKVIYKTVWI